MPLPFSRQALHFVATALMVASASGQPVGDPPTTLRAAARGDLRIGTAVMARHLDTPPHATLIAEQFNALTAENEMKPGMLQPRPGEFNFAAADRLVDFAAEHGMDVVGHTLIWHQQTPAWMFENAQGQPLPRDEALANMKHHIDTVMHHFKGRVRGWDVVNEAVADGPEILRDTPARRAIGDDYILKAFEFAAAADPDAELYYNDYNIELDYKRERALTLVRQIRAAGLRIDAVGIQGHYQLHSPALTEIERGLAAYADAGFDVMITELDVDPLPRRDAGGADLDAVEQSTGNPHPDRLPADLQQQLAERYRTLFESMLALPQIKRISFWGTHDGMSWLNDFPVRGRTNHPLLFDRQLQPKPAFDAVLQTLRKDQ